MSTIYRTDGIALHYSKDKNPAAEDFNLHVHRLYEVLCFVSGNVSYLVEGQEYTMYPGCIMLMRPAEIHKLVVKGKGDYERYVINFRGDILRDIGMSEEMLMAFTRRELGEKNRYLASEFSGFDTVGFFRQLRESCELFDPKQVLPSNIGSLLCAVNSSFVKKDTADVIGGDPIGRELISYVNDNLTNQISLSSVSEYVHMSPSQVNRIFRNLTGTSVYDYILSKRLVMVREMIEAGEGAVSASQKCGFGDYSSFYRLYKKRTGKAPGDAKKETR